MGGRTVELTVAGETCRVVTTASEDELRRLAAIVEEKLADVLQPGRPVTTKAMLLAAVALAHDLDEQQSRADAIAKRATKGLSGLLERVDEALEKSARLSREREGRRSGSDKGDSTGGGGDGRKKG
ncbi:MAG: cell division protein ZapA [Deltaproteobacteria bacterium]|jgi:cell division protein ZapA|nr:cell division protein ZapA [Deltaproteobacteria bacterium]MBW2532150.1 cell division protein ZapA [Deltaproteobacteria bacterium]